MVLERESITKIRDFFKIIRDLDLRIYYFNYQNNILKIDVIIIITEVIITIFI